MIDYSFKFNKAQLLAIKHDKGPLLVVAGAGTGKTSVLVERLRHLLLDKKISAANILLLTFTEKAAAEMEERVDRVLPYGYLDIQINTFHSFSEKILRDFGLDIGLPADFKLLNTTEQWILIKKNLAVFDLDYYRPLGNPNKFIGELIKHFSRLKDENVSSQEYLDYVENLESAQDNRLSGLPSKKKIKQEDSDQSNTLEVARLKELAKAYQTYNQLLLDNASLDFGDLITYCLRLFEKRPNILKLYRQRCHYIMVDEFQDTNWAQYELVKFLAAPEDNLMVVGDDDQAIYKFRGASLANIMQFKEDYPEAGELILTENYRSDQRILDRARTCIKNNNPNRLEFKLGINKKLKSAIKQSADSAVEFSFLATAEEELALVTKKIKDIYKLNKANHPEFSWSNIAILARSNQVAENFSRQLTASEIPNQFVSLRGLYRKPIVLNCLAYLRFLDDCQQANPLFRLFNLPAFGISYSELSKIIKFAKKRKQSLYKILLEIEAVPEISGRTLTRVKKLLELASKHSQLVKKGLTSRIFLSFIKNSGLIKDLDYDRHQEEFSYLNQFYKKIKDFEASLPEARLADFIEILDWEIEAGDSGSLVLDFIDNDAVRIMTVHAAKGLEFDYVFLVGLMERRFPTINRREVIPLSDDLVKEEIDSSADFHQQEERRLFYVAMTRARKQLHFSAFRGADSHRQKKISRFVVETGFNVDDPKTIKIIKGQPLKFDLSAANLKSPSSIKDLVLPDKFSFSQLVAFDSCPLQYKFAFVLKVPISFDKPSFIFGRVMHSVLYDFLQPLVFGGQADLFEKSIDGRKDLSWKRLKEILEKRWISEGYDSLEEEKKYYQQAQQSLKAFFAQIENSPPKVLFLEKNFSFRLDNDIIKGMIDRIDKLPDGSLAIIDYKTGESKEKLSYKDKRQLIFYQLFLEKTMKLKVGRLSYHYLNSASIVSFETTDQEKEKLEKEVRQQLKNIKSKKFPPRPSVICKFCNFRDICQYREI